MSDADVDRWLSTAMTEYKTLRDESLQAQRQQQSVLAVGFSAVALLTGLSVNVDDRTATAAILLLAVPLLVVGVTTIWLGEVGRMIRAGAYIVQLEGTVNATLHRVPWPALGWETALREGTHPRERLTNLYKATLIVLVGVGATSGGSGILTLIRDHTETRHWVPALLAEVVGGIVTLAFFWRTAQSLERQGKGLLPPKRHARGTAARKGRRRLGLGGR